MSPHREASNVSIQHDLGRKRTTSQALCLRQESDEAHQIWPDPPARERQMPAFTWEQLERQLAELSGSPTRAALTPPLVSALRKQSPWKPSEMVLREILCLAWTLMDEAFQPGLTPGEEAEMP
jgi:hypothetical protein